MEGMFSLDVVSTGVRTMAMLSIVLGLLVLVLYAMKRLSFFHRKEDGDLKMNILSSLYLSPKERVVALEIADEKIVLGVSPGNIRFLTKLNDDQDSADD
ncbi:MAG: flagellar biosynthetic protein FliO [Desulfobacterales bacterium]